MSGNGFMIAGDGWVQVTPCGEYPHKGACVTQVIDREACDKMVSDFNARKAAENFPGVLVDFDHFSLDTDKPSEAAGWISELDARDDGLWARVRWSDAGLSAVTGGRYRLLSPVFRHPGGTEDLGEGRVRPVMLESVALTNEPNIKGGKPIANRGTEDGGQKTADRKSGGARGDAEALAGNVMSGPGAKKFMWLLGDPPKGPHCGDCVSRNGQVKTLLEWLRMPAPKCHCYCRLAEVGKDVPEGYDPTAVTLNLGNRWAKPWGDKARAASLAVRRAKAAARQSSPGGTYADGQPVIRDLTDLQESSGPSIRAATQDDALRAQRARAEAQAALARLREMQETGETGSPWVDAFNEVVSYLPGGGVRGAGRYGRRRAGVRPMSGRLPEALQRVLSALKPPVAAEPVLSPHEQARKDFADRRNAERDVLIEAIRAKLGGLDARDAKSLEYIPISNLREYLRKVGGNPDEVAPPRRLVRTDPPAGGGRDAFEQLKALHGVDASKLKTPPKYVPAASPSQVREEFAGYLLETLGQRRGNVDDNIRELGVLERDTGRALDRAKSGLRDAQRNVSDVERKQGRNSPEYGKAAKLAEEALWEFDHLSRVHDDVSRELQQLNMNLADFLRRADEGSAFDWGPVDRDYNRLLEEARRRAGTLSNRWKYGWGDVARAASLAVRRAKALARKADDAVAEFLTGGIVAGEEPKPKKGVCYICGQAGHYATDCPSKVVRTPGAATEKRRKGTKKMKNNMTGVDLVGNRWSDSARAAARASRKANGNYTGWTDAARAAALAVRREKAAARSALGGTYSDGQPVIRDLTDIGSDYTGGTYITDADPVIERQRQYEEAFRQWWSGVETSAGNIEKFHAYVAAFAGAAAAAAGAARPAGDATGLFGATGGRYGGQKPVYDPSGNVVGWARVGGRPAAARRSARTAREPYSPDPLNDPKTPTDMAVREAYNRHLENLQRQHEAEMAARGLDPQGYPLNAGRNTPGAIPEFLTRTLAAARVTYPEPVREALDLYDRLAGMPVRTAEDREAYEAAVEGLRRFTDLDEAGMLERAVSEGILPRVRALLDGENLDGQPRGSSATHETGSDYPAEELPWFETPPGVVKESSAPYGGGLSAGAAHDAARALGVLHGAYGVGEDGVEIPEALRGQYELGRVEGTKGFEYGIVPPKDRAAVLRGAQAFLDGAVGESDGYTPDHLNDRYNLADWDSAATWATRNQGAGAVYDASTPDTRGQYDPASLMRTAMEWFRDAMVRGDRGESNAALSYMSDMLVALSSDRHAAVEAARGGAEGDDEDSPEVDVTMPVYDEDGVEIGGDEPFFEDSYADPNARMPWEWLGNRWYVHHGWSDAARAASLAVRRAKAAARNAAGDLQVDGPVIHEPLADMRMNERDDALEDYLKRKRRYEANQTRKAGDKSRLREEREGLRIRRNSTLKEKFDAPGLRDKFDLPGLREKFQEANEKVDRERLKDKYAKSNPVVPAQGFSVPVKGAVFYYNGNFYDNKGNWVAKAKPSQKSGAVYQNGLWYDAATGKTLGRTVAAS